MFEKFGGTKDVYHFIFMIVILKNWKKCYLKKQ